MSNEVKVGLLAIVAAALSFWGYKFIRGKNVLLKSNIYRAYYENVDRMQAGTPVFIYGVEVGNVATVKIMTDEPEKVEVVIDLAPEVRLPKDTRAVIESTGFMGGKAVKLEFARPCEGDDCLPRGSVIEGVFRDLLGSMVGTPEDVDDYMTPVRENLQAVLDEQIGEDSDTPLGRSIRELEVVLSNLTSTTARLNNLLASSSGQITGTLENLESLTGELEANRDKIGNIIQNAETFSSELGELELKKTLDEVNTTVGSLQTTLQSADQAVSGVTQTLDRVNSGEGTLGKLLQDEALYENLSVLSLRADSLVNDLQDRPYRYMPLKSRRKVKRFDRKDAAEKE